MGDMKEFVLFNVFLISLSLSKALDRTISVNYFAAREGDADLFWWLSLILLGVFVVGLYLIRKAPLSERSSSPPSDSASGLLLIGCLFFVVLCVYHVESVIDWVSAPQVPLTLRLCFVALTAINIGSSFCWTLATYRLWRKSRGRSRLHNGRQ